MPVELLDYRVKPPRDPEKFFKEIEKKPDLFFEALLSVHDYSREARRTKGLSPFIPRRGSPSKFVDQQGYYLDSGQREMLRRWETPTGIEGQFRWELLLKPREWGMSVCALGTMLRLATSYENQFIDVVANKEKTAQSLLQRLATIMDTCPEWWFEFRGVKRPKQRSGLGKSEINFSNGSRIRALPLTAAASRSEHLSFLFFDEIDHSEDDSLVLDAVNANRGSVRNATMIITTTSWGPGRPIEVLWNNPVGDLFEKHFIPYTDVPGCTPDWREAQLRAHPHDPWTVYREAPATVDEAFTMAAEHVFSPAILRARIDQVKADQKIKPLTRGSAIIDSRKQANFVENDDGLLFVKRLPEGGRRYGMGVDASRGGIDYNCLKVRDWDDGQDCALMRIKQDPGEFARDVLAVCLLYNSALCIVENRGGGNVVLDRLAAFYGYPNLYRDAYAEMDGFRRSPRPGFTVSSASKQRSVEALKEAIVLAPHTFHFETQLQEMTRFRRTESKKSVAGMTLRMRESLGAAYGHHDDTVSADRVLLEVMRRMGSTLWDPARLRDGQEAVTQQSAEERILALEAEGLEPVTGGPQITWR